MRCDKISLEGVSADLLVPAGKVRRAAVFLHGYDQVQLRDQPAIQAVLEEHGLACLCPSGGGCWWLDIEAAPFDQGVTPVRFLTTTAASFLQQEWPEVADELAIFGYEMGGQGALQVAYRFPRVYPRVVAISPKVDFETWYGYGTTLDSMFSSREEARQQTATLQLNPLNWPRHQALFCDSQDVYCLDGVVTLASKLSSSGVPFYSEFETSHGGFGWPYVQAIAERAITYLVDPSVD